MGKSRKDYLALYGNTTLSKKFCGTCRTYAFVIDQKLQCCDRVVDDAPNFAKREICPEQKRRLPSVAERKEQLQKQENCCFYCDRQFGSFVFRGTRVRRILVVWDHVVPYVFSQDNRDTNFVAACSICNGFKSDRLYPTLDAAKIDLQERWKRAGYC